MTPWYTCKVKSLALCPNQGCGYLYGKMHLSTHWKSDIDKVNSSGSAENGILCEKQVNTMMDVVMEIVHTLKILKKNANVISMMLRLEYSGRNIWIPCPVCPWVLVSPQVNRNNFVYAPSHWETMFHYNVASHWLGTHTKQSLGRVLTKYRVNMLMSSVRKKFSTQCDLNIGKW